MRVLNEDDVVGAQFQLFSSDGAVLSDCLQCQRNGELHGLQQGLSFTQWVIENDSLCFLNDNTRLIFQNCIGAPGSFVLIAQCLKQEGAEETLPSPFYILQQKTLKPVEQENPNDLLNQLRSEMHSAFSGLSKQVQRIDQTSNLVSRRVISQFVRRKIRCVFIVHAIETWDSLHDVYKEMQHAEDFNPIVVSIPRRYPGENHFSHEDMVHEGLRNSGVPHFRLTSNPERLDDLDLIKNLQPDVIFRQSPWEYDVPEAFGAEAINFARICYVPYYAFMLVDDHFKADKPEDHLNQHIDQPFHKHCWRIFAENETVKQQALTDSTLCGANIVVTGNPKLDRLRRMQDNPCWPLPDPEVVGSASAQNTELCENNLSSDDALPDRPLDTEAGDQTEEKPENSRPFRIVWAPHHSIDRRWLSFGMFLQTWREMLAWAQEDQTIQIVLKPHPALFSKIEGDQMLSPEEYRFFRETWDSLPNTTVQDGGNYSALLAASDAMITDGVSFLAEYQLFEKPLVFIDSGEHVPFNPVGQQVVKGANSVADVAQARQFIERIRGGENDPASVYRDDVLKLLLPYPGKSAQMVVQAIREGLAAESAGCDFAV